MPVLQRLILFCQLRELGIAPLARRTLEVESLAQVSTASKGCVQASDLLVSEEFNIFY